MSTCNVCGGRKKVTLALQPGPLEFLEPCNEIPTTKTGYKDFDCPQCTPMVPYRRVRAMKVTAAYEADQFGNFQAPIERSLAARFGEYLLREGLIRFTTSGSSDFGRVADKITVTAHLGVVSQTDVVRADADPEVAFAPASAIPAKLTRQQRERLKKISPRAIPWEPKSLPAWGADDTVTDEFDEPKDALANRFSGLEI